MQELAWIAEIIRLWLEGASWAEIKAAPDFMMLVMGAAVLVPSTLIALGIGAMDWHETPLGRYWGARPNPREDNWTERARDLDGDGMADF